MEHRRFLGPAGVVRPFARSELLARIGGRPTVEALVDGLYDRIDTDRALRPLFGKELSRERAGQKHFFVEWLGGDEAYSARAYVPLKHRHDLFPITAPLAERWLGHFDASLAAVVSDAEARQVISASVRTLAMALVNSGERPAALRARSHGTCLRYAPAIESLTVASRGDRSRMSDLLHSAPDVLASEAHAAQLLHRAAINGRTAVVELLLDSGVDSNKPSPIEPLIFVTPLCAARLKRRRDVETLLLERGAREDIFTHAYLGDVPAVERDLDSDADLAQVIDPAADALAITPLHHAVSGAQPQVLRLLLSGISTTIVNAERALRLATERQHVEMVRLLLERGVDASSLGAGRWVLHPELASLLSSAGAHVDRSGGWIGLTCTGNQGRKDDPEFVAALLRHGARVDDRRLVGQDNDRGRATALHYAARAGFLKTIDVLLTHGADPRAQDDNGLTPLDWLKRSAKSVDREKVRQHLR